MTEKVPARLHVLMQASTDVALVIRRGSSKRTAVIGWNRKTNKFTLGQWLKGRIYPYRSDISPDGKHWIYFAMDKYSQTWTAVANVPYLKAIDFYKKGDAWNGGGLFLSDKKYWLNEGGMPHQAVQTGSLKMVSEYPNHTNYQGECSQIYFIRLQRDGWTMGVWEKVGQYDSLINFTKQINDYWLLVKIFHASINHPVGKGAYYEEHKLLNKITGEEIACPNWEWAEVINEKIHTKYNCYNIVWAEHGKLKKGTIFSDRLSTCIELYDFNDMQFEEIEAPY